MLTTQLLDVLDVLNNVLLVIKMENVLLVLLLL